VFAARRMLPPGLWPKIIIMLVLGGLQGALGWYMVASGLENRVSVTQYRLAAHLTFACVIFAYVLWVRFTLNNEARVRPGFAAALLGLVFLQIAAGGFVAGLDAGQGYNTWPLMDGALVPSGLGAMDPWWLNLFENAMTVQFDHRLLAYLVLALALWQVARRRDLPAILFLAAVLLQVALGITTLLLHVPLHVALVHQSGALVVLAAAVWNLRQRSF
jgi:cytochrome c oxidase assembly protein subunit 15